MHHNRTLGLCGVAASIAFTLAAWGQVGKPARSDGSELHQAIMSREQAIANFRDANPGAEFYESIGRITKVYGRAFSTGATPHDSAEQFRLNHAGIFGATPADLIPEAGFEGGTHLQPIYFDGQPKFTGVNYTQVRNGLPVYRSRLILLARNDTNYPIVLASADLRDLSGFVVDQAMIQKASAAAGVQSARKMMPAGSVFSQATPVIFAGVEDVVHAPTLALVFIGEGGSMATSDLSRREFVTDAVTGEILFTENLIYDIDVTGTVRGLVTDGYVADLCATENSQILPYLRVSLGATNVFANANGEFTIPNAGSTDVTLNAPLLGQYFTVNNVIAPTSVVTMTATPGVPANIVHNATNAGEQTRAEVNAYRHANLSRDLVIAANPAYPTVSTQSGFPVNVNSTVDTCNAFYSASTINFYLSGGGCNNTGFGTVVHHEYGHNVVAKGGSGQGAYGEGMGDVLGVLVSDGPITGVGFTSCAGGIRTANNNCQYSVASCSTGSGCGSEAHACGNLISGCVWNLRNNLLATNPSTYRQILADLAINSILVHTGTAITPQITIDYLTLADDDGDLTNGGPYRTEIAAAFAAHGMPAPALAPLLYAYPIGRPVIVSPTGGSVVRVAITPGGETPSGTATLHVDSGAGFVAIPMSLVATNTYEAAFPATPCDTTLRYYVSAQSTVASVVNSPAGAPVSTFNTVSGSSLDAIAFQDNFQTNLGWTVTNGAGLLDGPWDRGVPVGGCNRGNPQADGDGSGACYMTDNSAANACNSDVDGGSTTLTSPNMDASTGVSMLSYSRWYDNIDPGNTSQDDALLVQVSFNGGANWQTLETVGPTGSETNGGWIAKSFGVNTLPGYVPSTQFRVRFVATDAAPGSIVEAAIDGVKLQRITCATAVPGDVNGDGSVNVADLLAVISAWGACPVPPTACPADVSPVGGDGQINVADLLFIIANWG